jgi:hypothetical protein
LLRAGFRVVHRVAHARSLVHDGGLGVFKQLVKQQPDVATKLVLVRYVANVSTSPPVLAALVLVLCF